MKALQVIQPRTFSKIEVPSPKLSKDSIDQILVSTKWISMCGSDIPFFTGSKRHQAFPLPWGSRVHECVGQVVESKSDRFNEGDWVVAIPEDDQGLAEFYIALGTKAVRLPEELQEKSDCCLIQPLSTVINGVDRLGDIQGKSFVVVGLGSIGLFFCWLLKKRGAGQITGIDPIKERCQMAREFGVDQIYPMRSIEVVHLARQKPDQWSPPEICIEAVGHQTATLNDSFELVQKQGTVLVFGVPDQLVYSIEFEIFFRKNLHLLAVVTPDWQEYLKIAVELYEKYRGELSALITHRFNISDAEEAFELYDQHGDGILKAIIDASRW